MIPAHIFAETFKGLGFQGGVGVPCSAFSAAFDAFSAQTNFQFYVTANEGEALAISSGAWLAGNRLFVYCQNSGLGNMVDPLTSLNNPFRIPVFLLITWRGQPGTDDAPHHQFMGSITPKLLSLLEIPHEVINPDPAELRAQILRLVKHMEVSSLPVALILPDGYLTADASASQGTTPRKFSATIFDLYGEGELPSRMEALGTIHNRMPADAAVIATTGKTGRELFCTADTAQHFYSSGAMGCASALALGISENVHHPVVILDGDGAALMRLEHFSTIGARRPQNLIHILLDNSAHDSTGGQATHSPTTDFAVVAQACNYRAIFRCNSIFSLSAALDRVFEGNGPCFIHMKIKPGSAPALKRPNIRPDKLASRFQAFLKQLPN